MAGMFDELYKDPLEEIEQSARSQAALGGWGTIAQSAGLAGGMLGRGAVQALGGTYKEDVVKDILMTADHESEEGRAAVLNSLASVDPEAMFRVQKMYIDMEEGKLSLEEKKQKIKKKKDEPAKEQNWAVYGEPRAIQEWLLVKSGLQLPEGITTQEELEAYLEGMVQADDMKSSVATSIKSRLKNHIKKEKEKYMRKPLGQQTSVSRSTAFEEDAAIKGMAKRKAQPTTTLFTPEDDINLAP